jgi:hypothetical protein
MSNMSGDCVYFGLGSKRSSGGVYDSSCRSIGRNAVSAVAGDGIRVERMTTDQIGFDVFDVEPNLGVAGDGSIGVDFNNNTIGSYALQVYSVVGYGPISDQYFTNNSVVGHPLKVATLTDSNRPRGVTVKGNTSDTPASPAAMNLDGLDDVTVTGNTVPMSGGTMASLDNSCRMNVSGNSFPGGSQEQSVTHPAC